MKFTRHASEERYRSRPASTNEAHARPKRSKDRKSSESPPISRPIPEIIKFPLCNNETISVKGVVSHEGYKQQAIVPRVQPAMDGVQEDLYAPLGRLNVHNGT